MPPSEQKKYESIAKGLRDKQIARLRDYAKTWAGTISALAGVSTVITAVSARDALVKLSPPLQVFIGCAFALAIVLAVIAVMRAVRAQIGELAPQLDSTNNIRDYMQTEPAAIAAAIKMSRLCALLSPIAFLVAIYATWYGTARLPSQAYLYPQATGAAICGTITRDATSGAVALKPSSPLPTIAVSDPSKLAKIDACP
jgi:hypothetical protein